MAKAVINQNLLKASGGFSKRTRWSTPQRKIDLQFQQRKTCLVISEKTKRSQKSSEKQRNQRSRWKLFDCIWKELTHTQREALTKFYQEFEKRYRQSLTAYHYFMKRALTNYMKEELEQIFNIYLTEIELNYSANYVFIKTKITSETFSEDDFIESFYERVARRT